MILRIFFLWWRGGWVIIEKMLMFSHKGRGQLLTRGGKIKNGQKSAAVLYGLSIVFLTAEKLAQLCAASRDLHNVHTAVSHQEKILASF